MLSVKQLGAPCSSTPLGSWFSVLALAGGLGINVTFKKLKLSRRRRYCQDSRSYEDVIP